MTMTVSDQYPNSLSPQTSTFPIRHKYKKAYERPPCPPPPPLPPPPPKNRRLLWGAIGVVLAAGGFAVYAK
ncbi:hypothetical protein JYU34_019270 [Plutella xylostella]|uniref:Uncharacterized protein n=1 Tax=Plutella xylostella TaxID=51655 RepID=A0ABQ7PWM7_PLUXY|nr:hypothetical protein JYU34_019270 [Plutella xylostella]